MKLPSTSASDEFSRTGFTLFEIVIALGLLVILGGFGLWISMDAYRGYSYRSERDIFLSALQKARAASMVNINEAKHGVHIDTALKTYTIFEGNSYANRNTSFDQVVAPSGSLTFSGLTDVVFDELTGATTAGAVTVNDGVHSTVISLNNEGQISW